MSNAIITWIGASTIALHIIPQPAPGFYGIDGALHFDYARYKSGDRTNL
ncbi:MAG: hypothetical protein KME50_01205 [Nostoc desertorum CM1-VF14]|nr:hypothetical protein [Nostoc desertorum CM1-VF14]